MLTSYRFSPDLKRSLECFRWILACEASVRQNMGWPEDQELPEELAEKVQSYFKVRSGRFPTFFCSFR